MKTACSTERLEQALTGSLSRADEERLHRHLDDCPSCEAEMERLAGGEAWCREAAILLPDDEIDHVSPTRDDWSAVDFSVDHLEPADEPDILGRLPGYDVLEIIGRGGMGVVLKCFDRELKRQVAVKVLAPHLAQSSLARKRFAREAQAAAAVVHPHVMAIHQVQAGGRLPFLVMPLVAGESLADRLKARGTLELKEVLRIGIQAAAGLAAAHEQGLVHRDVKPANILLEKGVERAVLTDFGLARAADDVSMTRWGIIAGTPEYMSPEQARGEPLDGRSDLFSLGCVLYETATGISPFRADSTMATLRRLVDEPPRSMASLNPELPKWFVAVVERLMEKEPARRFESAKEVSDVLEHCLAHVQQPGVVGLPRTVRATSNLFTNALSKNARAKLNLVLAAVVFTVSGWLVRSYLGPAGEAAQPTSESNLRRLTAALLAYYDEHGHLPPASIAGKDGKGGDPHSWRVEILPYLGQRALYAQYQFDEPWDSAANRALLSRMPAVFRAPEDARDTINTSYFGVVLTGVGPGLSSGSGTIADGAFIPANSTVFSRPNGARWAEIPDGTANTIAIVEAKRGVPWTKPEDIAFDSARPESPFGGWRTDGWYAGFADGGVRFIPTSTERATIVGLLTINGGEVSASPATVALPNASVTASYVNFITNASLDSARRTAIGWRDRFGERFDMDITGSADGSVWGTDVYTDDSSVAAASVHAGLVRIGERATVIVTIVKPPPQFIGSSRNGVTSVAYGNWPAAYVLQRKATRAQPSPNPPTNMAVRGLFIPNDPAGAGAGTAVAWRGRLGEQFALEITGDTTGLVWGTDVYTDDSPIAAAAVHAGLVRAGERARITLTIVKPPSQFVGSSRNGVKSSSYGDWPSAYVLQRVTSAPKVIEPISPPILQLPISSVVASPNDGNSTSALAWQGRFGERFDVAITGSTTGSVWGTDVYTCDSAIAAAAVHAGIVKAGESATVTVTIVKSPDRHTGSERHGVVSADWGSYPASFLIARKPTEPAVVGTGMLRPQRLVVAQFTTPETAMGWRGRFGEQFDVEITGRTTGSVWGTDVYTDDSSLAAAAVHAGVVRDGERATVTVTIVKSPEQHIGSKRNGVESADYVSYPSSFVLQRKSVVPSPGPLPSPGSR
ncbi:MAG: LCCL domain-containing protein [Gemmataceae bacterium]